MYSKFEISRFSHHRKEYFISFQMIQKLFPHVAEIQSYDTRKTTRQRAVTENTFQEKKNAPKFRGHTQRGVRTERNLWFFNFHRHLLKNSFELVDSPILDLKKKTKIDSDTHLTLDAVYSKRTFGVHSSFRHIWSQMEWKQLFCGTCTCTCI